MSYLLLSILIIYSCENCSIPGDTKVADIRFCKVCKEIDDAINFEKSNGSKLLTLNEVELIQYTYNKVYIPKDLEANIKVFQRKANIPIFEEYISYTYNYYENYEHESNYDLFNSGTIEFNCGTDLLGYKPKIVNHFGVQSYEKTPTKDISLKQFQSNYYSILKWLYSLESEKLSVKKDEHQLRDTDYGNNPTVPFDKMVLENDWQKVFFSHSYHLYKKGSKYPQVSIFPTTHAPTHLYEKRPAHYIPDLGSYHINVSDMAVRIEFFSEFTGLLK